MAFWRIDGFGETKVRIDGFQCKPLSPPPPSLYDKGTLLDAFDYKKKLKETMKSKSSCIYLTIRLCALDFSDRVIDEEGAESRKNNLIVSVLVVSF